MINFPSSHKDHGKGHVAGSQKAADEQIAGNMRKAAINFRADKRPTQSTPTARVVRDRETVTTKTYVITPLHLIVFGCMALALIAALVGGGR